MDINNQAKKLNFKAYILFTVLFSVFLTGFEYFPAIFQGVFISGDNRMNCFCFNRFYDNSLYPGWFICDVILHNYLPIPYVLTNFLLSKFFSLYQITLILPFILSLIVALLVFNIGKTVLKNDKLAALVSGIILLLYHASDLGKGGTIRAWGVPIILGFLLINLTNHKKIKSYIYICCSWWFYPITLGIFFIYTLFEFISETFKKQVSLSGKFKKISIYFGFIIVLTLNVIPLALKNPQSPFYKNKITHKFSYAEVKSLPEFGNQGTDEPVNRLKKEAEYLWSWEFFFDQVLNIAHYDKAKINIWPINFLILILIAICLKNIKIKNFGNSNKQRIALLLIIYTEILMAIFMLQKVTDCYGALIWGLLCISTIFIVLFGKQALLIPRPLILGFFASFAMFILLYCLPYNISAGMHFPARQLGIYLPWFLAIFAVYNYNQLIEIRKQRVFARLNIFVLVWLVIIYLCAFDHDLLRAKDQGLYSFIQTLPKPAIIAGHPWQMDFIPFFGKREVLACREIGPCYGKELWLEQKQKTFDMFDALYSADKADFIKFCEKYKQYDIYFVADKFYFSREYLNSNPYWQPFTPLFKQYAQRKIFFLQHIDKNKILYKDNDLWVIRCRDFLR